MNGETQSTKPQTTESGQEQRVQQVLARAQRETSVRDLLTFSVANIWSVLLALGAAVFALVHRPPPNNTSIETPNQTKETP